MGIIIEHNNNKKYIVIYVFSCVLFTELIARDKASWSEAARTDPDSLTLDEFLAFRHPESSHTTILALVDELLDKLGKLLFSIIMVSRIKSKNVFTLSLFID